MPDTPPTRSAAWVAAALGLVAALAFVFAPALAELGKLWVNKADYSHGPLVVAFAGYLLWTRRNLLPDNWNWPTLWGLAPIVAGVGVYFLEQRVNVAKEWAQGAAFVLALGGVAALMAGGVRGLRWSWPALLVLLLALPMPFRVEALVQDKLRTLATVACTAGFQTLGQAAYAEGNVIVLGGTKLGVAEACNGLSMLLVFIFFAVAIALVSTRPLFDRLLVVASAVPIALACNVGRILVTGFAYRAGWEKLGELSLHDLFGWLMMPPALLLIWLELKLIDWVLVPAREVSRDEVLRGQLGLGR